MATVPQSLSGHTASQKAYWEQLRLLDLWLFPHRPAAEVWAAEQPRLDSPLVPLDDRFVAKVSVNDITGCFVWLAGLGVAGYGLFRYDGSSRVAHRYAYQRMKGPVAAEEVLDHICPWRLHYCVNWDHLEAVSHPENVVRGYEARVDTGLLSQFQPRLWRPGQA